MTRKKKRSDANIQNLKNRMKMMFLIDLVILDRFSFLTSEFQILATWFAKDCYSPK